jgi:hypothetical protein
MYIAGLIAQQIWGSMQFVPVVDVNQNPLMPTTANRAASWIKTRKATPFWKKGIFCVRLNVEPSAREKQDIAVGIDPGSKWEGFTAKSSAHTFININADAVTWVRDAVETRRNLRRSRRNRNTPYRPCRFNRAIGGLAPSTKARWQWKLRLAAWLCKMYPVSRFVVEDVKVRTKEGKEANRFHNVHFSPVQLGKNWFYTELKKLADVIPVPAYVVSKLREQRGLEKAENKSAKIFSAHCVDSWSLANFFVGGHTKPENTRLLLVTPLRFHRRQLHVQNPTKGGIRKSYGGTISMGFIRGSLVKHVKKGLAYIGGTTAGKISLHDTKTGKRIGQNFRPEHCKFLSFNTWRTLLLPAPKCGVSAAVLG